MATLLHFSEAAALAMHAMALFAGQPGEIASAGMIARTMRASEAHTVKVCQRLARRGLLRARRGPHGGFHLARAPEQVRLLDVYTAIEGPVALTSCVFRDRDCEGAEGQGCIFGCKVRELEEDFVRYLRDTRLSDVARICAHRKGSASAAVASKAPRKKRPVAKLRVAAARKRAR